MTSQPPTDQGGSPLPVIKEVSAGGLVIDAIEGIAHAAVIARRNRGGRLEWCLPKGHVEEGETPAEAAVREILEETGIHGQVIRHLGSIDYWFLGETHRVHKMVHHYLLSAQGGQLTADNDPDAEAEEAAWIRLDVLRDRLAYPNERRLVQLARRVLDGSA
ncbi:MAG: NUDIX hydrolase [Bifidobacteriaceae bacterium]|jgi:8-oxo-dGTP pyrophosphatase MutT (NUDIX family)|nr:NUDIX hydrolase [Bifidobacteriaceae bacterium]